MRLDIERLADAHPLLPAPTAQDLAHKAALALQRRHLPGVVAQVTVMAESHRPTLQWKERAATDAQQLDRHRVTEDGAEAVALALVNAMRGWVVLRRLQRGEHADWLLRDTKSRRLVALEVSGTDDGDGAARLVAKLAQVAESRAARIRAACVVGFLEPHAALDLVSEV
jgi:hypothetical protein